MPTPSFPKVFLFSLLSSIITHSCSLLCLDHQKSLLLQLKSELIFEPRLSQKVLQWNQTSECCNWYGVECDGVGNVKGLQLDDNDLSGVAPDLFVNFSNLTTLSLRNCSLRGYFPQMIFLIPTLQYVDLSFNEFLSGSLPLFTQSGPLKSIALRRTNFSGLIPSSIGNLITLRELDLQRSKFTGSVPSTLANLTQLNTLILSYNFFSGSIPSALFIGFSNLETLELDYNSFTGNIPRSIFGLPTLQIVSLWGNQFTGQVGEFPIENFSNIAYIDFSSNRLEGPIPDSFFKLESLVSLILSYNFFSGSFELEKIRSLPILEKFTLCNNSLSVNVDSSSIGFPRLTYLGLHSCNVSEFPKSLKHFNWTHLDLSNNRISGEVPSWILGNGRDIRLLNISLNLLTDLQKPCHIPASLNTLDLHSNQFKGELPLSFPPQSNLTFLLVANNSFNGSIPPSLCNARHLQFLDLSKNKFSGSIHSCLFENTEYLEVLKLGQNSFSGGIPDNISKKCRLEIFDLNNNTLNGSIPMSLENCRSLKFINVGNNIIHDNFPCMTLSSLRVLVLRSNRLHGEVRCQKSWPDIQIVDISSNNFSGNLEMVNFSSWRAMMLASDTELRPRGMLKPSRFNAPVGVRIIIKGLELELFTIWPDVTAIDFSCNNFQGEIPDAIGDLQSLYLLNLSHNSLNTTIPKSFGALTKLEGLDLSGNQLTGEIPMKLADLTFLSFLNLSYNKLVGKIPSGRQFQTFSAASFKGNPGLCGFPLSRSCTKTDANELSPPDYESKKEVEWEYVSAALGYVVGLGIIVCLLLFCRSFRHKYFDKIDKVAEEIFCGRNRRRRLVRN